MCLRAVGGVTFIIFALFGTAVVIVLIIVAIYRIVHGEH
jgi:hypothetical protein